MCSQFRIESAAAGQAQSDWGAGKGAVGGECIFRDIIRSMHLQGSKNGAEQPFELEFPL